MSSGQTVRARERVPTGRRGRPSKSMIAAAMERPFCAYLHKTCLNNRLEGHKYCIDHIMNDKTAPYRQCTFVHPTSGRRCTRAAHKVDRRASPLCQYHRAVRLNMPPAQIEPTATTETNKDQKRATIEDLAHHQPRNPDQPRPTSSNTFWHQLENGAAVPSAKLSKTLATYNLKRLREDLTPLELPSIEEIATRHNNADSDTESVDNSYDLFKNASVFTEEEVLRTLRDKMIRLRRLYIEQYSHIQYLLKEKRLKYIQSQRLEDEMYGDVYSFRNYPDSPDYSHLRSMLKYHKTFGPDSLLQVQAKKRKMNRPPTVGPHAHPHNHSHAHPHTDPQSQGTLSSSGDSVAKPTEQSIKIEVDVQTETNTSTTNVPATSIEAPSTQIACVENQSSPDKNPNDSVASQVEAQLQIQTSESSNKSHPGPSNICIFSRTPYGCTKPNLPLSPYCRQHILYDNKQVLFRPCAGGMPPCLTPVVSYIRKNKCWLHTGIN